jgi:hypothetical protein
MMDSAFMLIPGTIKTDLSTTATTAVATTITRMNIGGIAGNGIIIGTTMIEITTAIDRREHLERRQN